MEEYIEDAIAVHYGRIQEYEAIKRHIEDSVNKNVTFAVETSFIYKRKDKLEISKNAMYAILDIAINKEQDKINKLIDAEIELRRREEEKNEVNRNS